MHKGKWSKTLKETSIILWHPRTHLLYYYCTYNILLEVSKHTGTCPHHQTSHLACLDHWFTTIHLALGRDFDELVCGRLWAASFWEAFSSSASMRAWASASAFRISSLSSSQILRHFSSFSHLRIWYWRTRQIEMGRFCVVLSSKVIHDIYSVRSPRVVNCLSFLEAWCVLES